MLQIAVIGDNAIAASICAMSFLQGHIVRWLGLPSRTVSKTVHCHLPNDTMFTATVELATEDIERALNEVDIAFVCVRHYEVDCVLEQIAPYLPANVIIGGIPGFGGFGILARERLPDHILFGFQRIPFVISEYDPSGVLRIGGIRRQSFIGTMPNARAASLAALMQKVLGVPTVAVSHYFNIELSPSNSFLNPARIYALFSAPFSQAAVSLQSEFFADWDDHASSFLLKLDQELQDTCRQIPRDTSFVAPILFQYEACDLKALTDRIRSLSALHGRLIPLSETHPKVPDITSNYFREDFDFGLRSFREIAHLAGYHCRFTNQILAWQDSLTKAVGITKNATMQHKLERFECIEELAHYLE